MIYESYCYHNSRHITAPRSTNANIKGVELEISDYEAGNILDDLIEEGIITCPETENEDHPHNIAIEDDGSVYKELIVKAQSNRGLLETIKPLCDNLNGRIVNGHGTSCHIHMNNRYLDSIGVTQTDIVKSAEFLAPILFKISGRDLNSVGDWARSMVGKIDDENLLKRVSFIDNNLATHNGRYSIINTEPCNTTELRIFSNYYNFNYNYIKMYIETVDFLIDVAKYMHDKSYVEEYDNLIEMSKEFFGKRRYKEIAERHNLKIFFLNEKERKIEMFNEELDYIKRRFDSVRERMSGDIQENAIITIRAIRDISNKYQIPNLKFKIYTFDIDKIEEELNAFVEEKIERAQEE